jgi:hypothetical protein
MKLLGRRIRLRCGGLGYLTATRRQLRRQLLATRRVKRHATEGL